MRRRIRKLRFQLWRAGGVDVVVTHAPPRGVGDLDDNAHRGFEALLELLDKYKPLYLIHGHVHLRYGIHQPREHTYGDTKVVNACERWSFEIPDREVPLEKLNQLIWAKRQRSDYEYT
jgi:Icc-related predicted phosphoesterase